MRYNTKGWIRIHSVLSTITVVVESKAESLGFTDVSSTITEALGDKYRVSIMFKYNGNPYIAYDEFSAMTLLSLKNDELTTFVMHRVEDLLQQMCEVSGKNKEIPQTEEEYEQKIRWYQL